MTPVTSADVSAVLVTRGNVDMRPILDTIPYSDVVIWDNSKEPIDLKVLGRYAAISRATNDLIYFQDDDVIFTHHDELLAAHTHRWRVTANWAHGDNPKGYDDMVMVGAGTIVDKRLIWPAIARYLLRWPFDEDLMYEADFVVGTLLPHQHVHLPYERLYAEDDTRLCRQPWQEERKLLVTERARAIRDGTYIQAKG